MAEARRGLPLPGRHREATAPGTGRQLRHGGMAMRGERQAVCSTPEFIRATGARTVEMLTAHSVTQCADVGQSQRTTDQPLQIGV